MFCLRGKCPATVFVSYRPQRGASASSAGRPPEPPRTLDSPVVPESGTAGASGGRRQFGTFCHIAPPGWTGGALMGLATRKPMLFFSLVGSLLFRFEERKLFSVLFQLPPRIARFSDAFGPGARRRANATARPRASATSARVRHAPPRPAPSGSHRPALSAVPRGTRQILKKISAASLGSLWPGRLQAAPAQRGKGQRAKDQREPFRRFQRYTAPAPSNTST